MPPKGEIVKDLLDERSQDQRKKVLSSKSFERCLL